MASFGPLFGAHCAPCSPFIAPNQTYTDVYCAKSNKIHPDTTATPRDTSHCPGELVECLPKLSRDVATAIVFQDHMCHVGRRKAVTVISRIWHGWTTPSNADAYEALLRSEIFPWIENRHLSGFHGIQLLRQELDESVEFITIMWFDSIENVREFAGDDPEVAVVLPPAQALLNHFDARSQHYHVVVDVRQPE
jgi:hypothetical protein